MRAPLPVGGAGVRDPLPEARAERVADCDSGAVSEGEGELPTEALPVALPAPPVAVATAVGEPPPAEADAAADEGDGTVVPLARDEGDAGRGEALPVGVPAPAAALPLCGALRVPLGAPDAVPPPADAEAQLVAEPGAAVDDTLPVPPRGALPVAVAYTEGDGEGEGAPVSEPVPEAPAERVAAPEALPPRVAVPVPLP